MKTIIIKTQEELDALPAAFDEYTIIEIRSAETILITKNRGNSAAELRGNSSAELWGNSSAELWGNSSAVLRENSSAVLRGNSSAELRGNSSAVLLGNSSAVLWGNSSAVLWEDSSAELRGNSSAELWGNSSAVLLGNSSAELWGNSSAVLRENSSAVLRGNSSAVLWGNSSAVLRENSSVEAHDFSMVAVLVVTVVVKQLMDYAIASFRGFKPKVGKKSKTATVVKTPAKIKRTKKYFFERVESDGKDSVYLYKSVNPKTMCDFQTGRIKYEGVVECPDFDPNPERECGGGLHLSPTRGDALSYNSGRLLKCKVKKKDIVVYTKDITKVRCRRVEVIGPA